LRSDIQSTGNPILRLMRVSLVREQGLVRAGLFGLIGDGLAVYRAGAGCAALPDGKLIPGAGAALMRAAARDTMPMVAGAAAAGATGIDSPAWPDGETVATDANLDHLVGDAGLAGPGVRAIVVVHRGKIVAERYTAGFSATTPLLGWSMTKTVTAGLIGLLVKDGRLRLEQSAGWPTAPGDARDHITIADLLAMSSGLHFDEAYGALSDVTRMLYLESDMAGFARAQPLDHPVGAVWSYSSGTAVILARIFQDAAGDDGLRFVRERLFAPLGMRSATIETDAHGTLVGSSYMYAVARDWARYGQFLLQGGVWHGQSLLPSGYWDSRPAAADTASASRASAAPGRDMSTPDLVADAVVKRFADHTAVDALSFRSSAAASSRSWARPGAARRRLLRMIAGFIEPDSGDIAIGGKSMRGVAPNRRPVNMVFQQLALFPMMSVGENVAFGLARRGLSPGRAQKAQRRDAGARRPRRRRRQARR
jgi:CubicO group peptidase (beta-lactamase class C family)